MKEYILEVKKLLPQSFCKKIISYYDNDFEDAKIASGLDKSYRNCLTKSLLQPKTFGEKICFNAIKEKLFHCINQYNKKFEVSISVVSELDLLKYETNNFNAGYKFHYDFGVSATQRHLSISVCLNNEYEGGEFVFNTPNGDYILPQNVGDAVVFPSNFMFPHQVNKITKGTRYALIGWVL